jgi:hypothetical protein
MTMKNKTEQADEGAGCGVGGDFEQKMSGL